MEKENIKTVTIEDFKNSQHILDYIDDDFAIVNSLDGIPYSNEVVRLECFLIAVCIEGCIQLDINNRTYYQEALCEVIASRIASRLGINHVEYSVVWENEEPFSLCEDFITRDTELISASHIMNAFKKPNNLSEYEYYIQCAEKLGVVNIRKEVEKMIVLDFIIANEDRHFNNFGLVRNAVTLEWIGAAPIFDCGTSLWYNTQESRIKPLAPSLQGKPFKKTHAEQIHLVKDFSWIDLSALDGFEEEADAIFAQSEYLSDARRNILVNAIRERINLIGELI